MKNKGITLVALVITILLLILLAGVSVYGGKKLIRNSELENMKTNLLLIKAKVDKNVENANFKLGTSYDTLTDETAKNQRLADAKAELLGEEISKDNISILQNININQEQLLTDNENYIYYYKLNKENLDSMGLNKLVSDEKNGWYVVKYNIKNPEVEIYNTKGFILDNGTAYSLNEMENAIITE